MNERNQNQQQQQDQEPAPTTRKAGCEQQDENAELQLARSLGFGCVAAMRNPGFMTQLCEHSRLFEQAYRNEQAGLPADYSTAFAALRPQNWTVGDKPELAKAQACHQSVPGVQNP